MEPGDGPLNENHPAKTNPIGFIMGCVCGFGLPNFFGLEGWLWWVTFFIAVGIGFGIGEAIEGRFNSLSGGLKIFAKILIVVIFWTAIIGSCVLTSSN